ncbi:prolipoprotein diacylglyceryl transferase [Aquimarina sp. AD10]|uniref:Phosphatidylglycerol--prolipoprotein diacylglyceryl transferase n=1 Tax=Aquimarina aggregata TaxID=1642818 RepID=A0A163AHT5_9FLAO|nr:MULTISPECIES: prolipoprotein diacylglyceryl transferase [Aquimarina]AXT63119.1 prolipoprotein diacylglyceryl transferase [Aquimarina sp. AD10]KZS40555.1 prolipoprotein diacylglyceryl transferase [Aquimarina aggregata]RKM98666.1 prolipoprotein diacylglyceryl transferase [Aquimarina sp. AD10]
MIFSKIIWNPIEGIDLGFFVIRFYSLMFVVAFSLGWFLMKKIYIRENLSMEKLDSIFIYAVVATLLGARLGHVFFYDWDYYRNNLLEIILPMRFKPKFEFIGFQGLASHGAAIGVIVAMYYYSKNVIQKNILWILDRIVIPVAFGAIFVRLGNFFNSEIIGNESGDSAFGVKFVREGLRKSEVIKETGIKNVNDAYNAVVENPQFSDLLDTVPYRHPAQLYEAFGYIFVAFILLFVYWKTDKRNNRGFLFGLFLILLWTVRFFVEYVKKSQGGFEDSLGEALSTGQWLSIPFIIAGIYFVVRSFGKKNVA